MQEFPFKQTEVRKMYDLLDWNDERERKEYSCNKITKFYSFLYRFSTNERWSNQEVKFGMISSQLSEIFWEHVENFNVRFRHVLNT